MNLIRLKSLSTVVIAHRGLLPNIQSGDLLEFHYFNRIFNFKILLEIKLHNLFSILQAPI